MACPVGLPLPLFTGQPHTFSLPRLVRPSYQKVSLLKQLASSGDKVTQSRRTCQGKKGVNKPCSFPGQTGKCPKTHEKSLVHAFANSQVVTTKRTPLRGGGVEVNWSYKFFLIYIIYLPSTPSFQSTPASQFILSLITPPNHISTLHK